MASIEQRKQRAREQLAGANEPAINPMNYDETLHAFLNYHNTGTDDKKKRGWVLATVTGDDLKALSQATDTELRQLGPLIRARNRSEPLSNKHESFIDNEIKRLIAKYKDKTAEVKVVKVGPTAEEKQALQATLFYGEDIQGVVDDYWTTRSSNFSMKAYLITNNVSAAVATLIAHKLVKTVLEVKLAVEGTDPQVNESYDRWKKPDLKKLFAFLQGILQDCVSHGQVVKAIRQPRVSKKPAKSPVAKLKYLKSFMELNISSIDPETILGADEFYAYRTNRRFIYYKAKKGETLQINGQTISGFDEDVSGAKTLRKPEVFFKNLNTGKVALRQSFAAIASSEGDAPTRIQDDMILLKAFT